MENKSFIGEKNFLKMSCVEQSEHFLLEKSFEKKDGIN
jgi:hypothetical protein